MDNPYMYLFIRDDLSRAQQIVQVGHAIDTLHKQGKESADNLNIHMVLIGVKGENGLYKTIQHLEAHEIPHAMFYEPDIAGHTAIATSSLRGSKRKALSRFSILK